MGKLVEVFRMEADVSADTAAPVWPAGLVTTEWRDGAARRVHRLLRNAYSAGGGDVAAYDTWFRNFTSDPEFDGSLCILAWSGNELAGAALCWSSAFVKDLCVAECYRRRGLGEALLRAAMILVRERGAARLALKVDADNPSGAVRLYRRCGFEVTERIEVDCDPPNDCSLPLL
jgi:ribosomal protein S18 acetylase RimI-like enzyme